MSDTRFAISNYVREFGSPKIVVIDLVREESLDYRVLESIKNGLFFSGKYESRQCIFNAPHIVVFSNEEPEMDKLSNDRWITISIE